MPQSGNVLLGASLDLLAVGLQSALYPSSRLHSPTAHVQHLHTREAVLLHRLGQDRNERLRVLRDRRVVYVSPSTPTRTEQRQDRQRLGERRLHHRAHHLRAQLVVYASRAAAAPTVQEQLLPPASTTTLLSPFATPQRRAARPLSRNNFSSDGTISFVKRISLSPLATPQPHARHSQLMSSASSAGKCSAVSVARKPGMSPLNRSLPARHAASSRPPKISMFFMLAYTPSRNMVVMYSTHGAPRLVPCASRSEA